MWWTEDVPWDSRETISMADAIPAKEAKVIL